MTVFFKLLGSTSVKAARKMLMKSTAGVNFVNVFYPQLLHAQIPNAQKKTVKSAVWFGAFGTYEHKSCM